MHNDTIVFVPNKYYLADYVGYVSGPYKSYEQALTASVDSDIMLIARSVKELRQPKPVIKEIVMDFVKKKYRVDKDTKEMSEDFLKNWEKNVEEALKTCSNTKIIGKPPVKGVLLNEMSDM